MQRRRSLPKKKKETGKNGREKAWGSARFSDRGEAEKENKKGSRDCGRSFFFLSNHTISNREERRRRRRRKTGKKRQKMEMEMEKRRRSLKRERERERERGAFSTHPQML